MKILRVIGAIVGALVVAAIAFGIVKLAMGEEKTDRRQEALEPFYTPPDPLPSTEPGTIIRSEPLGTPLEGAETFRFLYVTETPDGTPTVSSAMIMIPTTPAPPEGRKVIAWAHPTTGLADKCAPSRAEDPIGGEQTEPWMLQMVKFGWVVVATDYAGLGTPGPSLYLIGESEAYDVINSVRAARAFPGADAGSTWAVWGHSQGGHASLWSGSVADAYAPELDLVAVAAAAPAAELSALVTEQWDKLVSWVIGPEVVQAWPEVYPDLPIDGVVSGPQQRNTEGLAQDCIREAGLEGLVRNVFDQQYFSSNPAENPQWQAAFDEQSPPPVTDLPVMVIQGTADTVVIPNTTALLNERWCAAGSNLTLRWLGGQEHGTAGERGGTMAGDWFQQVFAGDPVSGTCDLPPTIDPSPTPVPAGE